MQLSEESWTHIGILGTVLVPIFLFWLDTRRTAHKQHTENQSRLTKIETMVVPIWDWFIKSRNGK